MRNTLTIFKDPQFPHWILGIDNCSMQFDVFPKNFIEEIKKKKIKLKMEWKRKTEFLNVVSYFIIYKND